MMSACYQWAPRAAFRPCGRHVQSSGLVGAARSLQALWAPRRGFCHFDHVSLGQRLLVKSCICFLDSGDFVQVKLLGRQFPFCFSGGRFVAYISVAYITYIMECSVVVSG